GSGKSTIMKIIRGYIENYEGKVLLNNKNIKDIPLSIINSSFLYISQNETLFNDSIKNNILGSRNIDYENYSKIINILNLEKIFDNKVFRENEYIEENGFNLSGGERQKIILARSLLNDFNYLIMDEALSELDEAEEKDILKNIINNFKEKTIIYITHKNNVEHLFNRKVYIEGE
ncbi:ATP-binding cassette domain-containing protein, partial [bacterium]|nr:ATP-binding cassette domain-containing protein [bacterium]